MFGKQKNNGTVMAAQPALAGAGAGAATGASAPTADVLRGELDRVTTLDKRRSAILSTIGVLAVVAAIAVIASTFFISVLQIRGNSMEPTLTDGQVVIASHLGAPQQGEVTAFYYNNKILLKRVIAFPGDWVDITRDGVVFVNGEMLQEDYLETADFGKADIEFPYQVQDGRYFVLGDNRAVSIDSRSNAIGTVSEEQLIGKAVLRVWPIQDLGLVH
ncbi:MAG: signal peptidase I [Eggerthellaceae bacterium]|nr:signal peptidase I [Eggerthellaceae bacterium]